MTDRREQILSRIFTVLQSVDGVVDCSRNRDQLPADKRPAILLLDGDENGNRDADNRGRPSHAPNRVTMHPEIYIAMDVRKPKNIDLGEDLNAFSRKIVKAIVTDAVLSDLCLNIFYNGMVTDLGKDRTMLGEAGIMIEFTYYLKPTEL